MSTLKGNNDLPFGTKVGALLLWYCIFIIKYILYFYRRKLKSIYSYKQENEDEGFQDPFCRAEQPQVIRFEEVTSAAFKIKSGIVRTPCIVRNFSIQLMLHVSS